jgi:plasmid replication initiation protein
MAEEGTEREAQLIPEDEQVALTPDVIRSEVNLLTFPFFALSRKGLREKTKTEYRAVVQRGDRKVEILWRVSSSSEYGYPGPFDQKVHKAIEEIINELPHPVRNPIGFSIYDLCRRMRLSSSGGSDYRKIKEALERIVATTVKSRGTFYAKGRKKWIDDVFHIYDRVVFRGE